MSEGDGHYTDGADYASLPVETKQTVAKHETQAETVKAYAELSKKLGSSFRLPDSVDGLDDAQRTELTSKIAAYNLNGVPDSAEGYDFTHQEGVEVNADLVTNFKAMALEAKVPPATAQKMVSFWDAAQAQAKAANAAKALEVATEGKKQLDTGGFVDGDMKNVQMLLATYVTKDPGSEAGKAKIKALAGSMDRTGLGNNAPLLLALKQIHADLIAEGKTFAGSEPTGKATGALEYPVMETTLKG